MRFPLEILLFIHHEVFQETKSNSDIQNRFIDLGIKVITNEDALVHVSGHPRRSELLQMYDWIKPQILVPVHGEAMHLTAQRFSASSGD
ncbi:hypothetical protein MNL09_03305 [Bartonella krasnovii]|nr:hypothetical protein MNL09_03305 [Bartonella krasnovii]